MAEERTAAFPVGKLLAEAAVELEAGESPVRARRATRLLQAYELRFWDAMAEGP